MAGELYEMKLAALLFIRCLIEGHPFQIASNMKAAAQFDDIVIGLFGQLPILVQQKHSSNRRKAVYDYRFTRVKGPFALLKYCETYSSLKKEWGHDLACCGIFEECIFVLYTNARVACLRQTKRKQNNNCKAKEQQVNSNAAKTWQGLLNTGGNFCPILPQTHPQIYEVFKNVPEYKRILKERKSSEEVLKAVKALVNNKATKVPSKEELDKLAAQLAKLKGVDCYEEFLPRVWIFGSQASEQTLNSLIQNDIKKLLGVRCSKSITDALLESVQRWWQYDNRFLNENSRLWRDILESRWELLSSAAMNRLLKILIEFDKQEIKRMKELLLKGAHIIQIHATDSPTLSCLKVVECLKGSKCIVVDYEVFKLHQNEIMSYSKYNVNLILLCEYVDSVACKESISDIEIKEGNWRIILISKYKHHFETLIDTSNLTQLQENSKEALLSKYISFQGTLVPLQCITTQDEKILSQISGRTILELLSDSNRISIGSPPTEIIEHYITRYIQRYDKIKKEILKENSVFAISGTDALLELVPSGEKVTTYKPGEEVEQSCRFFKINDATDFEKLCMTFQSIHWLKENGEFFVWVQSKGSIKIIKRYLAQATSFYSEMSLSERLIVLIAEPGMGKSTYMSYIAQKLKKLMRNNWVVKINLNDSAEFLRGDNPCPRTLLESTLNINGDFQKSILQQSLDVLGNIVILLDGFDEISPYYADQVLIIIQRLLLHTKVKQIWVTSRPNMKAKLEETFCTLPYVLQSFSEPDQKEFLCKFWNVRGIEMFAIELLNSTGRWINDKCAEFTGIPLQIMMLAGAFREEMLHYKNTGENSLPKSLDIVQLYEKFINAKLKIYFEEKLKVNVHNAGMKAQLETIREDFYEKHMICAILSIFSQEEFSKILSLDKLKQKIDGFLRNVQQGKEKTGIIMSINNEKPTFIHRTFAEYFAAMWLVQNYSEHQELVEHILFSPTFEIMRIFFDRSVTRDHILHVAVLNEEKHLVKQIVTSEPAVINSVDKCGRTALHLAVNNYGNPINNAYVAHSRMEILRVILSSQRESLRISDKFMCWTPLKYADRAQAWEIIELLLEEGADEKDMGFTNAALSDSRYRSVIFKLNLVSCHKNIIEHIINCKPELVNEKIVSCIKHKGEKHVVRWVTPLHEASLIGHREIAEALIENGANLEAQDDIFGETPLLWAAKSSQWEVVELLLSKGADITATSRETNANVIHFAAKSNNVDLLYLLVQDENLLRHVNTGTLKHNSPVWEAAKAHKWANVQLLLERGISPHCHISPKGNTLLHLAAKSAHNDTLCFILQYPEVVKQLNTKNANGVSPIECAARSKKWDLVQTFLMHGAQCTSAFAYHVVALGSVDIIVGLLNIPGVPDFLMSPTHMEKPLLMVAANSEQWDTFIFLLKHGLTLPAYAGTTPLHLAVKSNNPNLLDFVLDYSGLDVDVLNGKQETAFMCAAREANVCVLEHLLERGAEPLVVHPTGGYTVLHLAAEYNVLSVVTFLLENVKLLDDINRIDSLGRTPLMRAFLRHDEPDLVLRLLQLDVDCSHRYANGNTLMHEAAKIGVVEIGELLENRGVNPLERGEEGSSPLQFAVEKCNIEFAEWLLSKGANAYEMDVYGEAPISWIIGRIMEQVMKFR